VFDGWMLPAPPRPVEALLLEWEGTAEEVDDEDDEGDEEEAVGAMRIVLPAPPRPVWMRWLGRAVGWGSVMR
jgi:hypothetical protein